MKRFAAIIFSLLIFNGYGIELDHIVSVPGTGSVKVTADVAQVNVGVEVTARTAIEAQRLLSERQAEVLSALRAEKVEKLETKGTSLYPRYGKDEPTQIVGYVAQMTLSFSSPVSEAGRLLEVATSSGANQTLGIQIKAQDEVLKSARADALRQACANALESGMIVLDKLNLTFDRIKGIKVGSEADFGPIFRSVNVERMSAPMEITPQETDVSATVTLYLLFS